MRRGESGGAAGGLQTADPGWVLSLPEPQFAHLYDTLSRVVFIHSSNIHWALLPARLAAGSADTAGREADRNPCTVELPPEGVRLGTHRLSRAGERGSLQSPGTSSSGEGATGKKPGIRNSRCRGPVAGAR